MFCTKFKSETCQTGGISGEGTKKTKKKRHAQMASSNGQGIKFSVCCLRGAGQVNAFLCWLNLAGSHHISSYEGAHCASCRHSFGSFQRFFSSQETPNNDNSNGCRRTLLIKTALFISFLTVNEAHDNQITMGLCWTEDFNFLNVSRAAWSVVKHLFLFSCTSVFSQFECYYQGETHSCKKKKRSLVA